ncbi:MAG TPA: phosphatase domain-containing protein [Burkholderiaceae bacterium]|nr:phosphatase domain-containing protein [Burkholderiaceae bacterium]
MIAASGGRIRRAKPLMLMPYGGYANDSRLVMRGRVLQERKATQAETNTSAWRNFVALVRLLHSAEVPGAEVCAQFRSREHMAVTDREGYFAFNIDLDRRLERDVEIDLRLITPRAADGQPVLARASICVPPVSARFGVISDIDDTIVWTHVGNRRRMLWTLARSNAATRKPLDGVAALYRALHDGVAGDEGNPIFYVSSGPWNLHSPVVDFLRINGVPRGPVFMKDWGVHTFYQWRDHGTHKLASIREIMNAFAHLPFLLIGDSGESDPEIYREVVREFPGRVAAIYIRNVSAGPARCAEVARIADEVRAGGSSMLLITDSELVVVHEARAGRIPSDRIAQVRLDEEAEKRLPTPAEPDAVAPGE